MPDVPVGTAERVPETFAEIDAMPCIPNPKVPPYVLTNLVGALSNAPEFLTMSAKYSGSLVRHWLRSPNPEICENLIAFLDLVFCTTLELRNFP